MGRRVALASDFFPLPVWGRCVFLPVSAWCEVVTVMYFRVRHIILNVRASGDQSQTLGTKATMILEIMGSWKPVTFSVAHVHYA